MKTSDNGIMQGRYQVVPRTLVFIKNKYKYLLIHKKKQDSFGYDKLNGVGGHIEKGEEPYESALREIFEETGIEIGNLELTAILFVDLDSNPGIQVFVFKADFICGKLVDSEEGDLHWMSYTEIKKSHVVLGDVPELIQICEAHINGSKPAILKYSQEKSGQLRIVML
jgi:8-oxo-dGTP diphosphatase